MDVAWIRFGKYWGVLSGRLFIGVKVSIEVSLIPKPCGRIRVGWCKVFNASSCLFSRVKGQPFVDVSLKQVIWDDLVQCKRFGHLGL